MFHVCDTHSGTREEAIHRSSLLYVLKKVHNKIINPLKNRKFNIVILRFNNIWA